MTTARPAVTKTDKNGQEMEPPMKESMERWECFNGQEAPQRIDVYYIDVI